MGKKRVRLGLLEAYSDESGNSGSNLFDAAQPYFWTGTLLATGDIQTLGDAIVPRLCQHLGVDELHGSNLGLDKIEVIADDIRAFLESVEVRFVFSTIEKSHIAATKFVATLLDSDVNKGVSPLHYGFRGMRIPLTHLIIECMSRKDEVDFWEAYRTGDDALFREILRRVDSRVRVLASDPRLNEILGDAFSWAIANPRLVLDFRRDPGDAPNMVAFGLLIDGIHELLKEGKTYVRRFVHDDQKEFGRFMHAWFPALRRHTAGTAALAFIADLKRVNIIRCDMELAASRNTWGLQLIDIVLWLYRRSLRDSFGGHPRCAELVAFVADRAIVSDFSRAQIAEDAQKLIAEMATFPSHPQFDPERGRQFANELEQERLRRMGPNLRNR